MKSLALRFVLPVLLLAVVPAGALAQCPRPAVTTLTDGTGRRWDLNLQAWVVDGTDGAFDGAHRLFVNGGAFDPYLAGGGVTFEPSDWGRGVQIGFGVMAASVVVIRRVWADPAGGYVRYIDEFTNTNPGSAPTITVEYRTNVGYDARMEVVGTSDGDTTIEASDTWFVLDNMLEINDAGMPVETAPSAFCHVIFGSDGAVRPTAASTGSGVNCGGMFDTDASGTTIRYSISYAVGDPYRRLMHFTSQHATRADAMAYCPTLAVLSTDRYSDVPTDDRVTVVNWRLESGTGGSCITGSECTSGFCVDGICCDSACAGGRNDCQACARSAGAAMDGVCGPIAAGRECRAAAGPCDTAETCDGTASACPADRLRPAMTPCRAMADTCDRAETCTGTNPACPPDTFMPRGHVCRASIPFSCDFGARCSGMSATCPPALIGNEGGPCDDGVPCTYARCSGANCVSATGSCDDQDMCTTDSCMGGTTCVNAYMSGCVGGRDAGTDGGELYPDAPEPDGGDPFPDTGGGDLDGSVGPEGGVGMDGSVPRDAGPDSVGLGGGGCLCRAGVGRPAGGLLALFGLLLAIARRRG